MLSFPELSGKATLHTRNPGTIGTWPRPADVSTVLYFYYKALKCHRAISQTCSGTFQ